jgi:hypothetical protein
LILASIRAEIEFFGVNFPRKNRHDPSTTKALFTTPGAN